MRIAIKFSENKFSTISQRIYSRIGIWWFFHFSENKHRRLAFLLSFFQKMAKDDALYEVETAQAAEIATIETTEDPRLYILLSALRETGAKG